MYDPSDEKYEIVKYIHVCDAEAKKKTGDIVAATPNGLFIDEKKMQLEDWETIEPASSSTVFKKVLELNGKMYAAASDGLYAIDPSNGYTVAKVIDGKEVKAMCVIGKILVAMLSTSFGGET